MVLLHIQKHVKHTLPLTSVSNVLFLIEELFLVQQGHRISILQAIYEATISNINHLFNTPVGIRFIQKIYYLYCNYKKFPYTQIIEQANIKMRKKCSITMTATFRNIKPKKHIINKIFFF